MKPKNTKKEKAKQKKKSTLKVKKSEMLKEHIHLIRVLESGSLEERVTEAKKQKKELPEYR